MEKDCFKRVSSLRIEEALAAEGWLIRWRPRTEDFGGFGGIFNCALNFLICYEKRRDRVDFEVSIIYYVYVMQRGWREGE